MYQPDRKLSFRIPEEAGIINSELLLLVYFSQKGLPNKNKPPSVFGSLKIFLIQCHISFCYSSLARLTLLMVMIKIRGLGSISAWWK